MFTGPTPGPTFFVCVLPQAANSFWTDFSPRVDVTKVATAQDQAVWAKLYADLIRRTVAAAQQPALVYASTDRWWG